MVKWLKPQVDQIFVWLQNFVKIEFKLLCIWKAYFIKLQIIFFLPLCVPPDDTAPIL